MKQLPACLKRKIKQYIAQYLVSNPPAAGQDGGVGPPGEQGPAGQDGGVGSQGEQGLAGQDGGVGPQGEQGPAGQDGGVGPQGEQGPAGGGLVGAMFWWGSSTIPPNHMICDGSYLDPIQYPQLFSVFGYQFGQAHSLFRLPNVVDRFILASPDIVGYHQLGEVGGAATHTLSIAQMPSHSHRQHWFSAGGVHLQNGTNSTPTAHSDDTSSVGGNQSHNNMPPYICLRFIVCVA